MKDRGIQRLATAGILAAAVVLLTVLVSLPLPGGHGYINLGDAGVLIAAFLLGGPWGALCGGAASAVADLILGWGVYAPATFVIKGAMALSAGFLLRGEKGLCRSWVVYPCALIVPAGYFLFETLLYGTAAALPNLPLNTLQCIAGAIAAHAVVAVLRRRAGLLALRDGKRGGKNG